MSEINETTKLNISEESGPVKETEIKEVIEEINNKSQREIALIILQERKNANINALTGLANRRAWEEAVKKFAAHTERAKEPLSIVLIDIDNLKRINDTLGLDIGDHLLKFVAEALKGAGTRASDTIARIGGDEFACLLPNTNLEGAELFIERLRAEINKNRKDFAEGVGLPENAVDISVGLSQREAGEKVETTIKRADNKLSEEKSIKKK